MSAGHTPAPWELGADTGDMIPVWSADVVIAHVDDADDGFQGANARLIVSAPDGLAVAQAAPILSKYHGQRGFEVERFIADYDAWRVTAQAFIAKATGAM